MGDTPADTPLPADLLPVRDAARLVDRGLSTVRGWVRTGALVGYRAPDEHPDNARLLVSREAVLRLVVLEGKPAHPGRRTPGAELEAAPRVAEPVAELEAAEVARLRALVAELRADVRAALAERDAARAGLEAANRTAAVLEARCADLAAHLHAERRTTGELVDAERRRASEIADRLTAAEAERDALREWSGLPWFRRLLAAPKRLPGGDA